MLGLTLGVNEYLERLREEIDRLDRAAIVRFSEALCVYQVASSRGTGRRFTVEGFWVAEQLLQVALLKEIIAVMPVAELLRAEEALFHGV